MNDLPIYLLGIALLCCVYIGALAIQALGSRK